MEFCLFSFCPKDDIKDYLNSKGVEWEESSDLLEVASKCDVIYQTRIQKERFGERIDLYEAARGKYIVDKKVLDVLPNHSVIMHPLPRLDEVRYCHYEFSNFHSIHCFSS
jgi:aspartate carbamoyltransferase catalytic subunit